MSHVGSLLRLLFGAISTELLDFVESPTNPSAPTSMRHAACSPTVELDERLTPSHPLMTGTLFANDKSKGSSWLVHLGSKKAMRVDLPFASGNHESAISPEGRTAAVPNYELPIYNTTEGGGIPGMAVSHIDLDSGAASVLSSSANPYLRTKAANCSGSVFMGSCRPKPHGATFTPDGRYILVTEQVANGLAVIDVATGQQKALPLAAVGCQTPHLVRVIPTGPGEPRLAVTGCRGTNTNTPVDYPGRVAIVDLDTGEARALDSGPKSEGITVTDSGEVWVGANVEHGKVSIFGFVDPAAQKKKKTKKQQKKSVAAFALLHTIERVPFPLRLAFEPSANAVAVASMDLGGVQAGNTSLSALRVFDAATRELRGGGPVRLATRARGVVNMEGLEAVPGVGWYTGGFDSQAAVVVDAASLETLATILFPRCTLPAGFCRRPVALARGWRGAGGGDGGDGSWAEQAKMLGLGGYNNWGGNEAYCPATARNPFDRRQTVLDGFGFSARTPAWAQEAEGAKEVKVGHRHRSEVVVPNTDGDVASGGGYAYHAAAIGASVALGSCVVLGVALKVSHRRWRQQRPQAQAPHAAMPYATHITL